MKTINRSSRLVFLLFFAAYCLLPTAYSQEFDRIVIDAKLPRRLSSRSGRRQRRQEARHRRRGRKHVCLVRESDVEEADRHWFTRDARNHLERDRRHRRRRQGRDRHRIRIRDEHAEQGQALLSRGRAAGWTIPGRSSVCVISAAFTAFVGATSTAPDGLDLIIAPLFGPDAKPPAYQQSPATILRFRLRNHRRTATNSFSRKWLRGSCCTPSR